MNDKELIEFAAKAAGYSYVTRGDEADSWIAWDGREPVDFNPLTDDGDAFRLMIQLGISVETDTGIEIDTFTYQGITEGEYATGVHAWKVMENPEVATIEFQEVYGDNPAAATRLAIVKVAAEIGKSL